MMAKTNSQMAPETRESNISYIYITTVIPRTNYTVLASFNSSPANDLNLGKCKLLPLV